MLQAQIEKGIVVIGGFAFKIKDKRYPLSAIPLLIFQEIANVLRIGNVEKYDFSGRIARTCNLDPARLGFPGVIHCRRFAEVSEFHFYEYPEQEMPIFEITAGVFTGSHWVSSGGDYEREQIHYRTLPWGSPLSSLVGEFVALIEARVKELKENPNCFSELNQSFDFWKKK